MDFGLQDLSIMADGRRRTSGKQKEKKASVTPLLDAENAKILAASGLSSKFI